MSDLLIFTSRVLCREDFLVRVEKLAAARPRGIVLREKDLSEAEYLELARKVKDICDRYETLCILHRFAGAALALRNPALHLPLPVLRTLSPEERKEFAVLGASCHSPQEAREAERLGCTYITAGHVFDTDCKRGTPGRGLDFLRGVCEAVSLPVYAIGGIRADRMADVRAAGAAGACVMSGAMLCEDVRNYFSAFEVRENEI